MLFIKRRAYSKIQIVLSLLHLISTISREYHPSNDRECNFAHSPRVFFANINSREQRFDPVLYFQFDRARYEREGERHAYAEKQFPIRFHAHVEYEMHR